jgi:hypothetical protein
MTCGAMVTSKINVVDPQVLERVRPAPQGMITAVKLMSSCPSERNRNGFADRSVAFTA